MNDTDFLELRKDIILPGQYYRAGEQQTRAEWADKFPGLKANMDWNEWFIDLTNQPETPAVNLKVKVVSDVFEKRGLHSISYRMAAIEAIGEYQKRLQV